MELPKVRDFMDQKVPTLEPTDDILDAISLLLKHRRTGAPVVDEEGKVVGIVTEKDCLRLVAKGSDLHLSPGPVSGFMTREVVTVPPDMDIYFAAGLFLSKSFRRLPVVEKGKLVGAITRFDILRAVEGHRSLFGL